jgi:O-antigen ligase
VLALFFKILREPKDIQRFRSSIWYPLFGLFVVAIISTFYSNFLIISIDNLRKLAVAYLFTTMTIFFVRENQLKTIIPIILITSISFSAFFAVFGHIFNIHSFAVSVTSTAVSERAIGGSADPNFFAAAILISLPLIAHFLFTAQSLKYKLFFTGLFVHNIYAIIITYSRAAILILATILVILMIEHLKRLKPRHFGFIIILIAIITAIGLKKVPNTDLWKRMASITSPQADLSLSRRASYLKVAWDAIKENPLVGWGPGAFPYIYQNSSYAVAFGTQESGYARRAHNTYIEVIVGTGTVGLLLFLSTLLMSFRCLYKSQEHHRNLTRIDTGLIRSYIYSFFSLSLSILFLSSVYHKYIWLFFGLSAAAENILGQKNSKTDILTIQRS